MIEYPIFENMCSGRIIGNIQLDDSAKMYLGDRDRKYYLHQVVVTKDNGTDIYGFVLMDGAPNFHNII